MDETASQKMKTISVVVEGSKCYQKVTKNTTCGDVIQHLLKYSGLNEKATDSYFLSASNNITEQQLSNKTNILKATEDLMSRTNRVYFILRNKTRRFVPNVTIAKCRRLREKSSVKELQVEKVEATSFQITKHAPLRDPSKKIRGVKRLCQFVQMQKRRLSEMYNKLNGTAKDFKQEMSFINISKTENSLDQFLNNVNKENMQGFLTFCDMVATKEMENLSSALPIASSVDRSLMDGDLSLMQCKLDRTLVDHAIEILDGKLNTVVNESSGSMLNTVEDVTNDILTLEDKLYDGGEGEGRVATMYPHPGQRLITADPSRIRSDEKPVHSTSLASKTMTFLNKSRNQCRMMWQFGMSRLRLGSVTNFQRKEKPRCNSNLSRRADDDLSFFICKSKHVGKCNYFWKHSYVSEPDGSLDISGLDKELVDSFVNTFDHDMNSSTNSVPSSNLLSRNILPNDGDHSMLTFDSSSRHFSHVHDVQEEAPDSLNIANLKKKLANYSVSDSDISSLTCKSIGMSCDCNKTPCATFTRDYVITFGYSPEYGSDTDLSSIGSDDQTNKPL